MPARRRAPVAPLGVAVVAAASAALLTACSTPVEGVPRAGGGPGAVAGLERFYDQELAWGGCRDYVVVGADPESYADPTLECARLEVPLDYADPAGATAALAVMRRAALDPDARIGSLVTNPGGPGGSGVRSLVESVVPGAGEGPLAQRFDLVGFDPRGVGASTPAVDCLTDAERDAERTDVDVDPSPAGIAEAEADAAEFVAKCVERTGADVLATVGTRDVVRDLDVLRAALGDRQLSYLGFSYGTRIGSGYAEAFPGNVRALVLDGALDPTRSSADELVAQGAGFQAAFEAFAADCATQPSCPLGRDPAAATAAYQALTRPLLDAPVPVGERILSYDDAISGTVQALYLDEAWPILQAGLAQLAAGEGEILMALADILEDRGPDGRYSNSYEAFVAVTCVDEERITDPAELAEIVERFYAAAPFRDPGRGAVAARDACALWPVPPTSEPRTPAVEGLPGVLVISVTGDPATPYQAGVDLAAALRGRLLTVQGDQHTAALQGSPCVDDAVTAYLVELTLPPDGAECRL